jgi:hypothetical protein
MPTYTYDPTQIGSKSKDRMRFELGDTNVSNNGQHAAVSDEEIGAMITVYPGSWKRAKFRIVESIYRRFSYEISTSVSGMSLQLQARAEHWAKVYADMKKEISGMAIPSIDPAGTTESPTGDGGHYFYTGMLNNPYKGGE